MTTSPPATGRRERLKAVTHAQHAQLDARLMAFDPFADRARYACFLKTQYRLHRDVEALYRSPELDGLLPGLGQRSRLAQIRQDLADLGVAMEAVASPPVFGDAAPLDLPVALAWLYTVEGSNIGAAFLLKAAARIGLDGSFGARHLAPHPQGRAAHWRDFIAELDAVVLPARSEDRVDHGARAAFAAALAYVEEYCPLPGRAAS